jgi:hypothetical protein
MDIVALNPEGHLLAGTHISPDIHWLVFGQWDKERFPLLRRFHDYYADAVFLPSEIESAVSELDELSKLFDDPSLEHSLASVRSVFETARSQNSRVEALAD